MKETFKLIAVAALILPFLVPRTEAQISFTPYIGYNFSAGVDFETDEPDTLEDAITGAFLAGAGLEFTLPIHGAIILKARPSLEYYFLSGYSDTFDDFFGAELEVALSQTRLQLNGDLLAEFATNNVVSPYIGAGLIWSSYGVKASMESCSKDGCFSFSGSESVSGIGFNFLGGIKLAPLNFGIPFIEVGYQILNLEFETEEDDDFIDNQDLDLSGFSVKVGISIPIGR